MTQVEAANPFRVVWEFMQNGAQKGPRHIEQAGTGPFMSREAKAGTSYAENYLRPNYYEL